MRILFLSRWYPEPPDNGSKIRVLNLLHGLCERHQVTLVSFVNPEEKTLSGRLSIPAPERVSVCPYREFNPFSPRALAGFLSRTPRWIVDTYRPEMEALIRQTIKEAPYDLVIASQLSMAAYYRSFHGIPAIFEEAELGIYRQEEATGDSAWAAVRRKLTWAKHRRFMARVLENFRLCTVASEIERKLLAVAAPTFRAAHVIPNSIDPGRYRQTSNGRTSGMMVFAGSLKFAPNRDAIMWFLNNIYPTIRAEMAGARLTITGDPGHEPLPSVSNVVLTGKVDDVHSVVATSAVSLAPIRKGGGTRLKILESMALRTPVVATTKAVEGLEARSGEHLLIADSPRDFAQAVLCLLREPEQARKMADNAFRLVQSRYNSQVVLPRFMRLVEQAATSRLHYQQIQVRGER